MPLLVGDATAADAAEALRRLWDDDTLIVASTDLSHYLDYDAARRRDSSTAAAIARFDADAIGFDDAYGAAPLRGLLIEPAKRSLSIERLDLRDSGDKAGDRRRVVGYGAWVLREEERGAAA